MKEIVLNTVYKTKNYRKYSALIDDEDFERVNQYNWTINYHIKNNTLDGLYALAKVKGQMIKLHIFIMNDRGIDHINSNGLDCQKHNLRKATQHQNMMNQNKQLNCTSIHKGVFWQKNAKKWRARITFDYNSIHIGYFTSETDAAIAYNQKAKELFGEFAKLNIIQ